MAQPLLNDIFNLNSNDYPVKKGGTSDPFLIEFIDDNCNEKLLKLGMDFQVCLYHCYNKPDVENDPRLGLIIQFLPINLVVWTTNIKLKNAYILPLLFLSMDKIAVLKK